MAQNPILFFRAPILRPSLDYQVLACPRDMLGAYLESMTGSHLVQCSFRHRLHIARTREGHFSVQGSNVGT